jgi:hypothetical protein
MTRRIGSIPFIVGLIIILNTGLILAQEENQAQQPAAEAPAEEVQWVWAEVVSVDQDAKTILVKYLDYDTDLEKELTVNVDEKTLFENAAVLSEIKPQDTLSIDYITSADGKNIAQVISVERIEQTLEPEPNDLNPSPEKVGSAEQLNNPVPAAEVKEDNPPAAEDEGMMPAQEQPESPAEVEEMPTEPEHTLKE